MRRVVCLMGGGGVSTVLSVGCTFKLTNVSRVWTSRNEEETQAQGGHSGRAYPHYLNVRNTGARAFGFACLNDAVV